MTLRAQAGESDHAWHARFSEAVRLAVSPLVLFGSGFFTADFLLSGRYTWPQTSRVGALTLTVAILAYEFVYKEQQTRRATSGLSPLKAILYSCAIPYVAGGLALLALAGLAAR